MSRGRLIPLTEQFKLWSGEPRIAYDPYIVAHAVMGDSVQSVRHFFLRPDIHAIRLGPKFENRTVADVLSEMTPDYYKRIYKRHDDQYNPRTPEGLIALLGKVGHPLPQFIAKYIKQDETVHERILRDEKAAETIREYMSAH